MGTPALKCNQVQQEHQHSYMSLKQLQIDLKAYLNQNKVGYYTLRERRVIQQLYTFQQKQISDKIISLDKAKQNFKKDFLISQVDQMDLQVFDHLTFILSMVKKQNQKKSKSQVQTQAQNQSNKKIQKSLRRKELFIKQRLILNSNIKKVPQNQIFGREILQKNDLTILVPIQCFNGIGALKSSTKLKSQNSLLKIFVSKMQAINYRYKCSIPVIFLVNSQWMEKFKLQLNQIQLRKSTSFLQTNQQRQELSTISNYSSLWLQAFDYNIVPYKSSWPLMDQNGKILMNQKDQIIFNYMSGDILEFIDKNSQIKKAVKNRKIVQVASINNLLQKLCDIHLLGYLRNQEKTNIVVKVANFNNVNATNCIKINQNGFVQFQGLNNQGNIKKEEIYNFNGPINIQSYYLKVQFLIHNTLPQHHQHQITIEKQIIRLNERMKVDRILSIKQTPQFFFTRGFQDILHSQYTILINVNEQQQVSYAKIDKNLINSQNLLKKYEHKVQNAEIGYYRYCKKIILQDENVDDNQIVQIDPKILYGDQKFINDLCQRLSKQQSLGFPLIISPDKINN